MVKGSRFLMQIVVASICLSAAIAPAQFGEVNVYDTPEEFVAAIRRFTNDALERGNDSMPFGLAGDPNTYFVIVNVTGEAPDIIFALSEEIFAEFNDPAVFFAFLEDEFLDFTEDLPKEVQKIIEEIQREAEKQVQRTTANVLTDTPGGPLDEVFSQVALGRSIFRRPFANIAPPPEVTEGTEPEGAGTAAGQLADELAAVLRYTRFDLDGVDGNIYGVTLGALREQENMKYGIIIPYDRVDFDGTSKDADSFTASPFIQWILMHDPVIVSVGPYLILNYTFINDIDNFSMWGGGLAASVEKQLQNIWVRLGVAGEYLDADINVADNDVARLRYGGTVGFPIIRQKVEGRVFAVGTVADEGFLGGDDTFGSVGGEIAANISEAFALTFGFLTSIGHSDLSSYSGYLGGIFIFR